MAYSRAWPTALWNWSCFSGTEASPSPPNKRSSAAILKSTNFNRPNPIFQLFRFKQKRNKRITAAVLAFPFPFGIVALHRIYLGCQPHVPVVYIGSFGGVFCVLPFIDFVFLLSDKDIDKYNNKPGVFMWAD